MNINNSFQQLPDKFIPPNEKTTIWRYLDFTKFMVLLDSGKLFFSRCDKLGDSWEGSCPKKTEKRRVGILGDASSSFKLLREFTSVNCWHMNKYESMAMWEIYIKNNEGIAIKSSIKRLNESLSFQKVSKEEFFLFLGKIRYIDYNKDDIPIDFWSPFMHKRKSFSHEQELRVMIQQRFITGDEAKRPWENGISVDTDIERLIMGIYLAPKTPEWLSELVMSLSVKYGLGKKVIPSNLDAPPHY